MRNQEGMIELQKKVQRRTRVKNITSLFWLHALLSMSIYVDFFVYSPFPSNAIAEWSLQMYIALLWVVFCVMISWVNGRKYENPLKDNTSCLASLRTWYYFRLCFNFSCSGYDLKLIKKSHTLSCYLFYKSSY